MSDAAPARALPRLRQVVLAAADLDATSALVADEIATGPAFRDEAVAVFGLRNAVHPVGDCFVEIVAPLRDGTAVGRQLARAGGDCGYMCMFELADESAMRARVARAGVRVVHDHAEADIVDVHLHPRDVAGAVVALDVTAPPGSWRWAGPAWTAAVPPHPPGGLLGLTVAVDDPPTVGARWAYLLGVPPRGPVVPLSGGRQRVDFVPRSDGVERIVAVHVATPQRSGPVIIAGVRFDRAAAARTATSEEVR